MQQVHGNNVVVVDRNSPELILNCDGLITGDPEVTLVVRTADCLPISIWDDSKKVVALVHAGWRGLQKEIIKNAINKLITEYECNLKDIKIKIGPHICQKHYEVGEEFTVLFPGTGKYLSLKDIATNQLVKLGVIEKNIKVDTRCTFEHTSPPSYRRDKTEKRFKTTSHLGGVMF